VDQCRFPKSELEWVSGRLHIGTSLQWYVVFRKSGVEVDMMMLDSRRARSRVGGRRITPGQWLACEPLTAESCESLRDLPHFITPRAILLQDCFSQPIHTTRVRYPINHLTVLTTATMADIAHDGRVILGIKAAITGTTLLLAGGMAST